MPVMSAQSEGSQRSLCGVTAAWALLHKDIEDMDRRELRAFTPSLDLTGSRALSPPSRLPMGQC